MTKPKKFTYRIQYVDNTYQIVEWTQNEFKAIAQAFSEGKPAFFINDNAFRLSDVRAMVKLRIEENKPEQVNKEERKNGLTEWGFVDQETAQYLRSIGIDVSEVEGVN